MSRAARPGNRVRIIGGQLRGRRLSFPDAEGLRPTGDRIRETLFNWLGQDLTGRHCLDLFAGSGVLGFEAASRGAARVVLVERSAAVCQALDRSLAELGPLPQVERCRADALEFLARGAGPFDVVFVDPPFAAALQAAVLERLPRLLRPGALVYCEAPAGWEPPEGWSRVREGRAGAVAFLLLRRDERAQGGLSGDV